MQYGDGSTGNQTFSIAPGNGSLTYVPPEYSPDAEVLAPETISSNDLYVYGNGVNYGACTPGYYVRGTDGALTAGGTGAITSPAAPSGYVFCESDLQADAGNDLVATVVTVDASGDETDVPDRLASYAIGPDGGLPSTNTAADMPESAVQTIYATSISPSGTLVAAGGMKGLQIFNFNGSSPLTADTGLLISDPIQEVAWDENSHLFALDYAGKLYVFTITSTSAVQVAGSPYNITNALSFAIYSE